jgi:hypothetical protein
LATLVRKSASQYQGDVFALLKLLRDLEALHREIQETYFQDALPQSRQALYALLREMESTGGWPYIPRKVLKSFLNQTTQPLEQADETDEFQDTSLIDEAESK